MTELLQILISWLSFLYVDGRYRFCDSSVSDSFGGDAALTLTSDLLRWRLVRDRGQVFLDCQPVGEDDTLWYSTDLLVRLLTGEKVESAELDEPTAKWIEGNLANIEGRFTAASRQQTMQEMRELKRRRAKEMFG